MKKFAVLFFWGLLFGCAQQKPIITLQNSYDANITQTLLEEVNSIIRGSALLHQRSGGVVTCAGNEVSLIPVTLYSTERISYIYMEIQQKVISIHIHKI